MKVPAIFKKKKLQFSEKEPQILQDMKARVVKNREAILDIASQNIKGARSCPLLLGNKCLGQFCEFFLEFKTINNETGAEGSPYYRCAFIQIPLLQIETNNNLLTLTREIKKLTKLFREKEEEKNG